MSSNYYATMPRDGCGLPQEIHICKTLALGVLFEGYQGEREKLAGREISSWSDWKELLRSGKWVVCDECDNDYSVEEFIKMIEVQCPLDRRRFLQSQRDRDDQWVDQDLFLFSGYSFC